MARWKTVGTRTRQPSGAPPAGAHRLQPDQPYAHNNLGSALLKKGQAAAAIRQFQEAIRQKPDHADARKNLGISLYENGQIDEGVQQFQEAVRLRPDDADARIRLTRALQMQSAPTGR